MKRTAMLLSGAALAFSLASAGPARAVTPPNGAVQGTWAFGSYVGESDENVANGTLTFDGDGGVTGVLNYFTDGTYCVGMTMSGTYVVNPGKLSGSASMTVVSVGNSACGNNGDGDTLTMDFYLSNGLKTLSYVETDPDDEGYLPYDFDDGVLAGPGTHF
jgi:hypothetical protein